MTPSCAFLRVWRSSYTPGAPVLTFAGLAAGRKQPAVVVAVSALAVVPAGQVDAAGTAVTLDEALGALVDVCVAEKTERGCHISVLFFTKN